MNITTNTFEINFTTIAGENNISTNTNIMPKSITPERSLAPKNVGISCDKTCLSKERLSKTHNLFVIYANNTDITQDNIVETTFEKTQKSIKQPI